MRRTLDHSILLCISRALLQVTYLLGLVDCWLCGELPPSPFFPSPPCLPFVLLFKQGAQMNCEADVGCTKPWQGQYTIYKATRKPLPDKTPRLVYSYFFYLHKICYGLGSTGYFMIMADFFGVNNAKPSHAPLSASTLSCLPWSLLRSTSSCNDVSLTLAIARLQVSKRRNILDVPSIPGPLVTKICLSADSKHIRPRGLVCIRWGDLPIFQPLFRDIEQRRCRDVHCWSPSPPPCYSLALVRAETETLRHGNVGASPLSYSAAAQTV
jgi:hypothetical protein